MPIEVNDKGELITPEFLYGNLRSEAMNEIISRRPTFLDRWAVLIFVVIVLLLLSTSWFIHYPDIVVAKATLVGTNTPKEIVNRQEGRLVKLFIKNSESVIEGNLIGFIESNGNHEKILLLNAYLDSTLVDLQKNNTQKIVNRFANNLETLGELQQGYQQFITAYQQFADYLQGGFYLKKKKVLAEDQLYLKENEDILQQQKTFLLKDLNLSEETYKANEALLKEKVISKQDDRNEQSKLLTKQLSIPQINVSILANQAHQRDKQKEIDELEHSISHQKIIFQQVVQSLQNQVNDWLKKYIIRSPIAGKITFLTPLQENQFLRANTILGFIDPQNSRYYVEVNLPQKNFGKIDTGQKVQLKFDAYPYQEFGYVKGKLVFVTDFATDSGFLAHIQLTDGLFTNQFKILHYRDGLKAEAQIITKDMRLIERFYYSFISTIKR